MSDAHSQTTAPKASKGGLGLIVQGLWSSDTKTRRMSTLFILSVVGVVWVGALTVQRVTRSKAKHVPGLSQSEKDSKHIGEFIGKQAEGARRKYSMLNVGQFTLQLKRPANVRQVKGVMNMADMEMVVECDNKETCSFIEEHLLQARNEMTKSFLPIDRDELLTRGGKIRMKQELVERLNQWLPSGKVENVYISRLVIS